MADTIIEAFSQSLCKRPNDSMNQGDFSYLLANEAGIDPKSVLENPVLNNIPILDWILSVTNTAQKINNWNLLNQTSAFFQEFYNVGELSKKAKRHLKEICSNPQTAQNEIGRVLILLNRNVDKIKSQYYAKYMLEYLNNRISHEDFFELLDITDRMFVSDFKILKEVYQSGGVKIEELSYRHDRLISFGLLQSRYDHRPAMVGGSKDDSLLSIVPIGKRMCDIIFERSDVENDDHID